MIVDDEPLARKGLQEYCADVDFLEVVAVCDSPVKAVDLLQTEQIHLLFLDIQMPRINGLDLVRSLPQPPLVIFTTAFPEYAVQGFELDVVDYLLKPIAFERFLKAALKARAYFELLQRPVTARDSAGYFFIKCDNGLERICFDDILLAEALQNYVVLHTLQRKYITYLTFKAVEDYLPEQQFLRVHKSYIVALSKIDRIAGSDIIIGPHYIPISRHLREEVMERILRDRYLKR
jgi:DNA-binding LytR/AlgR family response regulator